MKKFLNIGSLTLKSKFIIVFFLMIFIGTSIIGIYGYMNASRALMSEALEAGEHELDDLIGKIDERLHEVPKDLHFFEEYYAFKRYLDWRSLGEKSKVLEWKKLVQDTFKSYLEAKEAYSKIRFIGMDGKEEINVRYSNELKKADHTNEDDLQDKSKRGYFEKMTKLDGESIYVSAINLNREFGKVIHPHLPVIRYAMPALNKKNEKHGIIVLSVYAKPILDLIENAVKESSLNKKYVLIDKEGSYIYIDDKEKLWDADLKHGFNLKHDDPELYGSIIINNSGMIMKEDVFVNYQRVYPLHGEDREFFVLYSITNKSDALVKVNDFKYVFFAILIVVLAIIFLIIRYFMDMVMGPLSKVTRQLQSLREGRIDRRDINYTGDDEIGEIIRSTMLLKENTNRLIEQTYSIANGDYSKEILLRSKDDRLSEALINMRDALSLNAKQRNERSWIQEGMNLLSSKLSGNLSLETVSEAALAFLAKYLDAGQGALYVYDKEQERVKLQATYAYNDKITLANEFRLGEGTVGQVALEQSPILLKNIKKDERSITSALIDEAPANIYTIPLVYEKELYGVMELSSFELFDEIKQSFLSEAKDIIATYLYSSTKNEEIKKLLVVSEEATKEAQRRSEELQQTNTQMEEQQQQLQQQSEELQQANVQMEEQQQQLRIQAEELTMKNESLLEQQRELEESNRYKSEFLANMSHELRTPLNSIILLSKLLVRNDDKTMNESDVKKANVINRAGNELLRLINDILDISKIEAGKMKLHLSDVRTSDISENMSDFFESAAVEKNIDFIIEDNIKGQIHTDREKLFQILRNFLSNSFKFTKEGSVSLLFEKREDKEFPTAITVADTGIGIPKHMQEEIFEAFKQVDGSITREFGGTGLGLAIALQFTELLGGKIELVSDEGKGSAFTVILPESIKTGESADAQNEEKTAKAKPLQIKETKKRLLIIEDDSQFASIVAKEAVNMGYEAFFAATGNEGVEKAINESPDGIVLDRKLPDMSGIEVLREIKKRKELGRIPVYIISGAQKDSSMDESEIVGYLQKPVNIKDIERALKTLEKQAKEMNDIESIMPNYVSGSLPKSKKGSLAGKRVLVVDDDVKNIFVLSSVLENEGAMVIDALNGKKAIEVLESEKVDLVVMDIMMPEMNGYEAIKSIRSDERISKLPIIALTAKAMKDDKSRSIEAGADDYITKPVEYETLVSLVKAWIDKKR